ncbi:hypothetical protein SLEP1_g562 [Rubroshorea leprosula]|uniref:DUF4283 domain-containing protein n=1 Tax=Rubroshorea leprosula TaxID=152421 RepID=A0AAV5HAW2_9ROSI|nr:hypothetical protein SLEP1_g562 [Rubroshorea leprosula]
MRDQPMKNYRSYAEVLTGKGTQQPKKGNELMGLQKIWVAKKKQTWKEMEFNLRRKDWEWLEKCYVGTPRSMGLAPIIQERLYMEGMFSNKTRSMGGKLVLLDGEDKGTKGDCRDAKEWLNQWFVEVKPWNPTMVVIERLVWLKYFGVPLHVWGLEFFASIAMHGGRIKQRGLSLKSEYVLKSQYFSDEGKDESGDLDWVKESILRSNSHGFQCEREGPTKPSEEEDDDIAYNHWQVGGQKEGFFKLDGNRGEKSTNSPMNGEWRTLDKRREKSVHEEFNEVIGDCVKEPKIGNHSNIEKCDQ